MGVHKKSIEITIAQRSRIIAGDPGTVNLQKSVADKHKSAQPGGIGFAVSHPDL